MKKPFIPLLALLAVMPAGAAFTDQPNDTIPTSLKGKRITFFFNGCHCSTYDAGTRTMSDVKPGVTLRFVNFNYGNTSNGKGGGTMTYSVSKTAQGAPVVVITDDNYSGTGYRVKGNPKGDSGEWHLIFEMEDSGSAWFMGTENGKLTYYHDVAFVITPVSQDATRQGGRSIHPTTPAKPGKAGVAPESMDGMVITLMPREDQPIENEDWVKIQMFFGKDYEIDGTRCNHMVAYRQLNDPDWHRGSWVNAYMGESEECLYPGYLDYIKLPDGTARIQLSGESSATAYYILRFDSPTTGTLTFHHEDYVDDEQKVICHMEGIPFKVTHSDYTNPNAPARGVDPETYLQRSFKAEE